MPFKCTTFTVYDLSHHDQTRVFRVVHDLRFIDRHSGYFLLKGTVTWQGKNTTVNRTLILTDGGPVDKDTFRYRISRIEKSPTDETPDALFNEWLAEIIPQPGVLQLDTVEIKPNTWLIGSPVSFLFTCARY